MRKSFEHKKITLPLSGDGGQWNPNLYLSDESAQAIRPKVRQTPTSIMLDPDIITKLKEKAHMRGIGYQTMLKIIIHEHVDEY